MDQLEFFKLLTRFFLANAAARQSWNTALIAMGLGTLMVHFHRLLGESWATLGVFFTTAGVIAFIFFIRLWVGLVLIKYVKFLLGKDNFEEYIKNYGYEPSPQLKKALKLAEKQHSHALKKMESGVYSPSAIYDLKEAHKNALKELHAMDIKIHIERFSQYKHTPLYFYWWASKPWRWSVYLFVVLNVYISISNTINKPFVILSNPTATHFSLLYGAAIGLLFFMLYSIFCLSGGETWAHKVPETLKKLCMFSIGFLVGLNMFMYSIQGFINENFGTEKTRGIKAMYWRESPRWCTGWEVHYDMPLFPDGKLFQAEQILCVDKSFRTKIKPGTIILASGPGTMLGVNVKTISSPDNNLDPMPSPKWD